MRRPAWGLPRRLPRPVRVLAEQKVAGLDATVLEADEKRVPRARGVACRGAPGSELRDALQRWSARPVRGAQVERSPRSATTSSRSARRPSRRRPCASRSRRTRSFYPYREPDDTLRPSRAARCACTCCRRRSRSASTRTTHARHGRSPGSLLEATRPPSVPRSRACCQASSCPLRVWLDEFDDTAPQRIAADVFLPTHDPRPAERRPPPRLRPALGATARAVRARARVRRHVVAARARQAEGPEGRAPARVAGPRARAPWVMCKSAHGSRRAPSLPLGAGGARTLPHGGSCHARIHIVVPGLSRRSGVSPPSPLPVPRAARRAAAPGASSRARPPSPSSRPPAPSRCIEIDAAGADRRDAAPRRHGRAVHGLHALRACPSATSTSPASARISTTPAATSAPRPRGSRRAPPRRSARARPRA